MPKRTAISLTPTRVDRFRYQQGGPKAQFLWDLAISGLGLEAVPSGRRSWVLSYRILDKKKRITLGGFPELDLYEARDEAKTLLKGLRKGVDPAAVNKMSGEERTVQSLYDEYVETRYYKTRSKDFHNNFKSTMRRYVLPEIGDQPLMGVQRAQVRGIVDDLANAGKEGSAQGVLTHMRVLFGHAIEKDYLEYSPADRIRVKKTTPGYSDKWLQMPEELRSAWWFVGKPQIRALIRWCLLTGCRRDEARETRWCQIDREKGIWSVERTKNRRPLVLPLMPVMNEILDELEATFPGSDFVFPATTSKKKAIPRGSMDYLIREGTKGAWSMHVLRHTVESWLAELGVVEEHRNLVLNHWSGRMSERYRHGYQLEDKRKALQKWHEKLVGVVK
ncbi:MAG: tyrosine-type recombinase/integrase [Candidatus Thiodiazotropha sp. (ex Lucinoma borealis)]|nr:tyrosine-type recombinase/integrase [Candidatus Thiodiazotropha sp. (ex Lucinoma borealis)]